MTRQENPSSVIIKIIVANRSKSIKGIKRIIIDRRELNKKNICFAIVTRTRRTYEPMTPRATNRENSIQR